MRRTGRGAARSEESGCAGTNPAIPRRARRRWRRASAAASRPRSPRTRSACGASRSRRARESCRTTPGRRDRARRLQARWTLELSELGQREGILHARRDELELRPAITDEEGHQVLLGLAGRLELLVVEHAEQCPGALEDATRDAARRRRLDREADLELAARPGPLHGGRDLRAVAVADHLTVDVEQELRDGGVHFHRLEFEPEPRGARAAAEKHVTDRLRLLKRLQRRGVAPARRVAELPVRPGLRRRVDHLREVLLEEIVDQAAWREQA